ncbi:MAG: GspH/FimT family pseudopilin [Halioglobus sp.]
MTAHGQLPTRRPQSGFTMVELLVAVAIVGLLMAVTVPGSMRFYQSIQYRQAVRDVLTTLGQARHQAMDKGQAQDVGFDPERGQIQFRDDLVQLPKGFAMTVTTASEVNQQSLGVIRFYPEGGSTGGDIDVTSPRGRGVRISVDWLMGSVSQEAYDVN